MSIDLTTERLTLSEAAKLLGCNVSTIWRWVLTGVRGQRLPSFVIGGRRYIARQDLDDFLAAQNQDVAGPNKKPSPSAERRDEAAKKKLDDLGI